MIYISLHTPLCMMNGCDSLLIYGERQIQTCSLFLIHISDYFFNFYKKLMNNKGTTNDVLNFDVAEIFDKTISNLQSPWENLLQLLAHQSIEVSMKEFDDILKLCKSIHADILYYFLANQKFNKKDNSPFKDILAKIQIGEDIIKRSEILSNSKIIEELKLKYFTFDKEAPQVYYNMIQNKSKIDDACTDEFSGMKPIAFAAALGRSDLVEKFLSKTESSDAVDALCVAALYGQNEAFNVLFSKIDDDDEIENSNILACSIIGGNPKIVSEVLNVVDIDSEQDSLPNGRMCIHYASMMIFKDLKECYLEIIKQIIKIPEEFYIFDQDGKCPIDYLIENIDQIPADLIPEMSKKTNTQRSRQNIVKKHKQRAKERFNEILSKVNDIGMLKSIFYFMKKLEIDVNDTTKNIIVNKFTPNEVVSIFGESFLKYKPDKAVDDSLEEKSDQKIPVKKENKAIKEKKKAVEIKKPVKNISKTVEKVEQESKEGEVKKPDKNRNKTEEMKQGNTSYDDPFKFFIKKTKNDALEMVKKDDYPIDFIDPRTGDTPAICAVKNNLSEVLKVLIEKKCDLNAVNNTKNTAASTAVNIGRKDIFDSILSNWNNPSFENFCNLLTECSKSKDQDFIKKTYERYKNMPDFMKAKDTKIPNDNTNLTYLHVAVRKGNLDVVKFLIDKLKIPIDSLDDKNETPLFYAIQAQKIDVAKFLIDKKCNLDVVSIEGKTALIRAIEGKSKDLCKMILDAGADPNLGDDKGENGVKNAFIIAILSCSPDMVKLILDQGKIDLTKSFNGSMPLQFINTLINSSNYRDEAKKKNLNTIYDLVSKKTSN